MVNKEKGGKQMKQDGKWDGFRRLVLVDKIKECDDITSFYFKAEDGGKPVSYTHLTLPTKNSPCRSRWAPYH